MITHRHRSILGPIPESWGTVSLRECLLRQEAGDWGDDMGEALVQVLRSTNFTSTRRLDLNDVATRWFSADHARSFDLKRGDILLERSGGGPTQPVGRVVVLDKDMPGTGFSNFVQLLRVDHEKMLPDFVAWCLFALHQSGIVERLQHQTTQMRNLDYRDYLRVRLPKPSPEEQRRIVAALTTAAETAMKAEEELQSALATRATLLGRICTLGIVRGGQAATKSVSIFHARESVPESWTVPRLGKLVSLVDYGTNAPSNGFRAGYPVIAIPQVIEPVLTRADWPFADIGASEADQLRLAAGDVLLIRTNGNSAYIGKSTVVTPDVAVEHVVFASYLIRVRTLPDLLLGEYLNLFLSSPLGRRQSQALANTSAGNHNLGSRSLKGFVVPLPSIDEQREALAIVSAMNEYIVALQAKFRRLVDAQRSLSRTIVCGFVQFRESVAA